MNDSKGSAVVVCDQGAEDGLAGVVVVPDGGGEGEEALKDAGDDAVVGASAVSFEIELAFQGVVDGLDELAQRFEEPGAGPGFLAFAGGAQERGSLVNQERLEFGAGVTLVGQDDLTGARAEQGVVDLEEVAGDLTLVDLRVGEGERDGQTGGGADQMQAQPPEVAGVAGAVAVAGVAGQVRAFRGRPGPAALDRGGVDHPDVVEERV